MTFKKGTHKDMDPAAIQCGINETLTTVVRGAITRCASIDKMRAALYAGVTPLCIVATNDTTSGLVLRAVSHPSVPR
jgi:hypothetical protein